TAAGDLISERFRLGYLPSAFIFGAAIAVVWGAYWRLRMDAVLAFWIAYILTRPLGASIGDFLSQAPSDGGLGLSNYWINAGFFIVIIALIIYLTITGVDQPSDTRAAGADRWSDAGLD
ncbi:MAG: hypothetical protein ACTHJ3_17280, partial [Pararhizobium sp.]